MAQSPDWLLTTADFQTQAATLNSIDDKSIAITIPSPDGEAAAPSSVDLDRLLLLERATKQSWGTPRFSVILSGGDRAAGQPVSLDGDNLIWDTAALGRLTLPLKSVSGIARIGTPDPRADRAAAPTTAPQTEDIVTLLNGDSVHGIIVGIDAQAVSVQQSGGDKTPVPLDSIVRVSFVSTGPPPGSAPAQRAARGFRVSLNDSTAVTASALKLDNQLLTLSLPTGQRTLPLETVLSIEQVNGPVTWLSSITPDESVQIPSMDGTWPARMNRAVDGGPIRFGDRTFAHGIGVHSYSRLSFSIDPAAQSFRTQYAIAGELPYADVTVRIKLDGQTVHEQSHFHCGTLAKPIIIDVSGHKQLTLEVDFGGNSDVQDRFNWIEPAFLNFKP